MLDKIKIYKILLSIYIILFFIPPGIAVEGLCALGMLYLTIVEIKNNNIFKNDIFRDKLLLLLFGFLLFIFISSLFSYFPSDSLYQYRKIYLVPMIVGISILVFHKYIDFKYIYKTMSLSLFVLGIWYFYESYLVFGNLDFTNYSFYTPRDATFTIPIIFPFVIFGLYEFYKDKLFTFISLLAMSMAILLVIYSGSRGAVLAFSTEILVFIYFTIVSKNLKFIIFPIIFGFVFYIMSNNPTIDKKFHDAANRAIDPNGRMQTIQNFIPVAKDNIILGTGIGNKTNDMIIRKYNIDFVVYSRADGILISEPHNTFLKILYQSGIIPLLCYIMIILLVIYRTYKLKRFIHTAKGKLSFAIVTVFLDHFVLRGNVEDLKLEKFVLIVFISIALYHTTLKIDEEKDENSIPVS
jgi:O-antigen ligase